jgi:hypothetical protein
MYQTNPIELVKMAGEIGLWFKRYRIPIQSVKNLREARVGAEGRQPFATLSAKRCTEWFHMNWQPSTERKPQEGTGDWIRALHACIKNPTEYQEVLRCLPIREEYQHEIFGAARSSPRHVAQYPQVLSSAQEWCDSAARQASQGQPVPAWSHLKMTFNAFVARKELESALVIVPTLIYITYRHFTIEKVAEIATAIRSALAGMPVSRCNPLIRRLAAVQLSTVLTEHGEGERAQAIFQQVDVNALLHDQTPLPWPKVQIMRTMAAHVALHDPCPRKAERWLDQAAEIEDPLNQRGISAMRYTVAMQHGNYGEAWGYMEDYYKKSRKFLLSHTVYGSHLKVCNDVYLGMLARHFSGTAYDRNEQLEDVRALQWGLGVYGINKPQMEDELMRYPVRNLFYELGREREGLIRTPFSRSTSKKASEDVIALVDVLLDKRSD